MILPLKIYAYYTTFCKENAMFCEYLLTASADKNENTQFIHRKYRGYPRIFVDILCRKYVIHRFFTAYAQNMWINSTNPGIFVFLGLYGI